MTKKIKRRGCNPALDKGINDDYKQTMLILIS